MELTTARSRSPYRTGARLTGLLAVAILGLSACVYRIPIQQGNHLDAETLAQVKPGMTHTQVRYLLGTPLIDGGFQNDRWDYVYYLRMRRLTTPQEEHATVYFRDDVVDHVVGDVTTKIIEPVSQRPVRAPGA
jgi:outer membrane protein assembly factor BamE